MAALAPQQDAASAERIDAVLRVRVYVTSVPELAEHTITMRMTDVDVAKEIIMFEGENAVFAEGKNAGGGDDTKPASIGLKSITISQNNRVLFERVFTHVMDTYAHQDAVIDPVNGWRRITETGSALPVSARDVAPNRFGEKPSYRIDAMSLNIADIQSPHERTRLWDAALSVAGVSGTR
jgi:hypothetical protein